MKKFLSIVLSIAIVLSLAVCPVFALETEEIINATGDHWEVISIVDMGEGLSATSTSTNTAVAGVLVSMGTNVEYKEGEGETEVKWPLMAYDGAAITKADLIRAYPHLEFADMRNSYFKWNQTQSGSMLRIRKMLKNDIVKNGDTVRISMEICITDMVGGMNSDGSYLPADGIDSYSFGLIPVYSTSATNDGSTSDGTGKNFTIPVNQWTTISGYFKTTKELFSSIRFQQNSAGGANSVKLPYPKTILLGRVIVEKLVPNNQPLPASLGYTEDFDRFPRTAKTYTIDGTDTTDLVVTGEKHPYVTTISEADAEALGEASLTYKDSANPNDKNKYAKGSVAIDTNTTYEYVYPTSGTAHGKYHLTGDASLGDTGVTDATFGLGYAGNKYFTTSEHLSAADRLASSTAKRSVITLPSAFSGNNMLVASGLYNKNAAVRMNNIFGSHTSKNDVGKKMIISYYVYADSKMGAYKVSDKAYDAAEPVAVDKTKPVKLMTSFNGPMGNIYKYRMSYDTTAIANIDIPWDTWTKVQVLCEITSENIDNLVIENGENTLKNCLQISQFGATDQIADTLYFDNLSVEEIEAGTKAEYAVYEFDGSYDIAVKITSSTEAGTPTVQLVVGEYDSHGNLISVRTSENKTFSFSSLPVAVSISNLKPLKETTTLRAFLIDSYTGLCPYISPADVKTIAEVIE